MMGQPNGAAEGAQSPKSVGLVQSVPPPLVVLYASPYVPAELIAAHGLRPCRALTQRLPLRPSGEPLMGACAYAQAFMDQARAWDDGPIIFSTTCDQMRRAADQLCSSHARPVFLLNVPATWQTDTARGLYRAELERLGAWLVRQGGQPPSPPALASFMQRYDQTRQALLAARATLSGRAFAEKVAQLYQLGPEHVKLASTDKPLPGAGSGRFPAATSQPNSPTDQLLQPAHRNACPMTHEAIPLALVGGPLMPSHFALYDCIESFGGQVVLDGTLTGERGLPPPFDKELLSRDPLSALVTAYFDGIPDVFRRPNAPLFAWLRQRLAQRRARGIILWHYAWCDLWQAEVSRLKEQLGLPLLHLDAGDATELTPPMVKRVQAFLEMLGDGCARPGMLPQTSQTIQRQPLTTL